jgi:CBS domain-containing protein
MRNESIDRVMTVSPATVAPDDLLAKASDLFASTGIHHVPVVDSGQLVGILSASDFLKLHLLKNSKVPLDKVTVRQLMQANPVVLNYGANLRDAAEEFSTGQFHALPVVDDDGAVAGIVTTIAAVMQIMSIACSCSDSTRCGDRNRSCNEVPSSPFDIFLLMVVYCLQRRVMQSRGLNTVKIQLVDRERCQALKVFNKPIISSEFA